jgi:thiamine pyrophosphokinase
MDDVVVVVAGGGPLRPEVAADVAHDTRVLAADGGLAHALELGLAPEAVIGDLDSAPAPLVAEAEQHGVRIVRHPSAKDATDLELALDEALAFGPRRLVVLASAEGRLDHLLSALLLLGSPRYAAVELDARFGPALVHVIRGERELEGREGELVSLLALHGSAEGVRTQGLAFPLTDETLEPGSSRGVSNVFLGQAARVSVARGVVLAVRPGPEEAT